jgi:uncharacterized protein YndB with AHSA1/START domain
MATLTLATASQASRRSASDILIVNEYAHPPEKVWRALTDPAIVPRWTSTGKGGRPVGFAAVVGTRFQYVAKPMPGWSGVVECEARGARALPAPVLVARRRG